MNLSIRRSILAALLLTATLSDPRLDAQLVVARGLAPNSFARLAEPAERMRLRPWAEFQRAPHAAGDAIGWNYKLGLDLHLFDLPGGLTLSGELAHEMAAAHTGSLGFDPRGAVWSEALVISAPNAGGWNFALAGFARCRHDIDGAHDHTPDSLQSGERVVVLMGPQLRITAPRFSAVGGRVTVSTAVGAEYYRRADDRRVDLRGSPDSWESSTGSLSLSVDATARLSAHTQLYVRGWSAAMRFRAAEVAVRTNYRVETGLRFPGETSTMELLLAHERTFDDLLNYTPRAGRSAFVGLRFTPFAPDR